LRGNPDGFDVVLMDVQMPVMDGYTATREIKADPLLSKIPVIALTAGAFVSHREEAKAAGMEAFLPKPFNVDEMVEMIVLLSGHGLSSSADKTLPPVSLECADFPGVNLSVGVDYFRSEERYRRYLNIFFEEYEPEMARAVSSEHLASLAHKMKSAAAFLGLISLQEAADDLVMKIKAGNQHSECVRAWHQCFAEARDWARTYLMAGANKSTEDAVVDDGSCSDEWWSLMCEGLDALRRDDVDAIEEVLFKLADWPPADRFAAVRNAVERFDLREAEMKLQEIMQCYRSRREN